MVRGASLAEIGAGNLALLFAIGVGHLLLGYAVYKQCERAAMSRAFWAIIDEVDGLLKVVVDADACPRSCCRSCRSTSSAGIIGCLLWPLWIIRLTAPIISWWVGAAIRRTGQ